MTPLLTLLSALVLAPGADAKEEARKVTEKIQGTWKITKLVYNGGDMSDKDFAQKLRLSFKGKVASVQGTDQITKEYAKLEFTFDPTTMPALLDLEISDGSQKGVKMEGIYELKGDTLTLCIRVIGTERPAKLEAPEGTSIALVVLEREKP